MNEQYSDRPSTEPIAHSEPGPEISKGGKPLGSLTQAARGKQLNQARGILFFIGIATILLNAVLFFTAEAQVKQAIEAEIAKLGGRGRVVIDQEKLKQNEAHAVLIVQLIYGVTIGLGIAFVVFGLIVKRYPVPVTIISLVLYVTAALAFAVLDPSSLLAGIIIKVIIVVALIKAIQAALAYEKEKQLTGQVATAEV